MSILIKNTTIITQNKKREILKNTDVFIEGQVISQIGKIDKKPDIVIDGTNKILMPGLINTHTHTATSILKGYGDDMLLNDWLEKRIWPVEAKLTPEFTKNAALLSMIEMVKTGTTTFNDMYFFMESVLDATHLIGMRANLSYGVIDLFDSEKSKKEIIATKKFIDYVVKVDDSKIRANVGPHAIYTCSKETLIVVKNIADKNKIMMHIHVSETKKEVEDCIAQHKMRPVEYLEKIGVLGENVIFAHACHLNKKEIEILKKYNVKIAHCPASNMKLATGGVIDWPNMQKLNVCVSLGTDGSASNNNLDMFEEMKLATLLQKHARVDACVMTAQETLDMATLGGAKALGLNAGKIEVGVLADVILLDSDDISLIPTNDIVSNIVYSANGSCVDTVIIDGNIVMHDRKLLNVDEAAIKKKCEKIANTLCVK